MEKISYEQIIGFLSKHEGETHTYFGWIDVLKELRDQYSPLLAFVNQLRLNGRISNAKLYENYVAWCRENNFSIFNKRAFAKRIPMLLSKSRRDIKPYRSNSERGFYSIGIEKS